MKDSRLREAASEAVASWLEWLNTRDVNIPTPRWLGAMEKLEAALASQPSAEVYEATMEGIAEPANAEGGATVSTTIPFVSGREQEAGATPSGPKETSVEKRRCRWEADREGQDQCVLAESHGGMHQYGPVVFVDDSTPAQGGRVARTLSASDIRLRNLDRLINQPEPNVIVNPDGSCSPASDLRARLEALRDEWRVFADTDYTKGQKLGDAKKQGQYELMMAGQSIAYATAAKRLTAILEGKD